MAVMAFALLVAASATPEIKIQAAPGGRFNATTAAFDSGAMTEVTDKIKAAAEKRCGTKGVRFGKHSFDTRVDTARNVMRVENFQQIFFCYDRATDPYKPVPAGWTASATETANATVYATRFLERLNRGDAAGIAMWDPLIEFSKANWDMLRSGVTQHRTSEEGTLTPRFVQWYNNPDWGPYPGAYAYFSVWDDHPGIAGTCGGILVQRVRENEYRISQYDVQYISQALVDQQGMTDEELNGLCAR